MADPGDGLRGRRLVSAHPMVLAAPPAWRPVLAALNEPPLRLPDGEPGIRDVDAPCIIEGEEQ